ncbi:MAG: FtsX-like permease family protein, partial [Candidatus Odinarchaeota archaeon]|nr:FtsX-like permease family protein [Candidatus Odinarchaeota archaeon]
VAPLGAVAVVNKAIIGHTLNFTKEAYILVRVDDGADVNNVAELINSTLGGKISHLRVAENYYNTITSYIENRAYFSFLYLNLTVMLFFLTVGQATIYIDKFEKMKKEMVILRTLGLEPAQISKYVYLDTLLNTFVASIFGILLALLQSYNLSRAVLFNMGPLRDVIFPVEYIVPIELWGLILLVLVASTLIGNLPVVYNLKSLNIAREMRYEFG